MECEICGKQIRRGYKIIVEGTEMTVCEDCKSLGVEKPKVPQRRTINKTISRNISRPKVRTEINFGDELVEDYHIIIRRERERRGWSQEELAKRIQEKVSLLRKIENAEITPEPDVIEKLERVLGVKLRESVEEVKIETKKIDVTPTLGDIVIIKRKKS